jgi:hypothetical protein
MMIRLAASLLMACLGMPIAAGQAAPKTDRFAPSAT